MCAPREPWAATCLTSWWLTAKRRNPAPARSARVKAGLLGDNPAPGLLLYEHRFQFDWVPAPYVTADQTYAAIGRNRPIRVYKGIDSRLILDDLYAKLALFAQYMAQKGE